MGSGSARGHARIAVAAVSAVMLLAGCGGGDTSAPTVGGASPTSGVAPAQGDAENVVSPVQTSEADWQRVAEALGRAGTLKNDGTVYRVSFPRSDLSVVSEGVQIDPGLALGSFVAFARYPDGTTMVTGDLVVTEDELQQLTDALQRTRISQSAIHKHLLEQQRPIWWSHIQAKGDDAVALARGIRAALNETGTPPATGPSSPEPLNLDTAAIDQALGTQGTNKNGIYKFSFARAETVTMGQRVMPPATGMTTAINFQPTGGGRAAINGDFVMTADEVQGVIQALHAGGIKIVSLHNHWLEEQPRLFYMHFWAHDDATALAETLRRAVDAHNVRPAG
jgi:hypothetical protein